MSTEADERDAYDQARFDGWRWCALCEKRWNVLDGRLHGCRPEHDRRAAGQPVVEPPIRRRSRAERYSIEEMGKRAARTVERSGR